MVGFAAVGLLALGCNVEIPARPSPDGGSLSPSNPTPSAEGIWSLEAPVRPTPPAVADTSWVAQPIDNFILAALEAKSLHPAPEADRRTLIRRASFDARGLPPTPDEIDAFLADTSADAYGKLVDRLLADPAYGEHRAHYWLDLARYADTHGFEGDNYRSIWPYRDYVIRAFNDNMPFDRFAVEQLAGDLLPAPTVDQRVATGFIRCTMSTDEGGSIADEYAAIAAKDRVEAVAAAFMGLTVCCAACHNHKFDPISQRDFYQMTAFFRNTTQPVYDENRADPPPTILVGTDMTPTLVDEEKPGLPSTHVLLRGQYDHPSDLVYADVPAALPRMPSGQPANRLGLARWVVAPDNPLFARVVANRLWAEVFGTGIVATPENFGRTGAPPSNQPLLDWLAVELRESGYDLKHLLRVLLTSATERQAATRAAGADAVDPTNLLLSHGPRFRLDAEMVRDQALVASGLLVRRQGGAPVKPYQPPGVWEAVSIDGTTTSVYVQDTGDNLFRRSVYTLWKRAAPPPAMEIFNAPDREHTLAQRERTNTPLQALVTMNDPQFVEAARHLATNAIKNGGRTFDGRIDDITVRVLARPFEADERTVMQDAFAAFRDHYRAAPDEAAQLLDVGDTDVDKTIPATTLAAWTMVASTILNLDEALNK
jgi:hypothetical protein